MSGQLLSEVRDQLESRATRTSINELQKRGMRQVRVIRPSAVLQLIRTAVDKAMAERGLSDSTEQEAVVDASKEIFQGLMGKEWDAQRGDTQTLLNEYRQQLEQTSKEVEGLRSQLTDRERALQDSQTRGAELNAELQMLHKRANADSPDSLMEELRTLRSELSERPAAVAAPSPEVNNQLARLGEELGGQIEKISRKVGIAPVEDVPTDLSALFEGEELPLESNIDTLDLESNESKGTDVEEALARMRRLKSGP